MTTVLECVHVCNNEEYPSTESPLACFESPIMLFLRPVTHDNVYFDLRAKVVDLFRKDFCFWVWWLGESADVTPPRD